MTITINTDASFSNRHKIGGWACSIVCDDFRIRKSGGFRVEPDRPQQAEIMAIGQAAGLLLSDKVTFVCNKIVINSDCIRGMREIRDGKSKYGKKVLKLLTKVCKKGECFGEISWRHVKAHTDAQDARSKSNQWCDEEAKRALLAACAKKGIILDPLVPLPRECAIDIQWGLKPEIISFTLTFNDENHLNNWWKKVEKKGKVVGIKFTDGLGEDGW